MPFGYGVSNTDVWRPYGVNECIRFTKYQKGDHFGTFINFKRPWVPSRFLPAAKHRDGAFVLTDEERSVHTIMVYLNESRQYLGGETVFHGKTRDVRVQGVQGKGLVFKHNLWHEGCALKRGVKYILRTDLMFVRISTTPFSPSLSYTAESEFHAAEALYQKSIECATHSSILATKIT